LFVSLARYSMQKNIYGMVSAFADVAKARPDAHLLIAGNVDDRAYAQQARVLCDRIPELTRAHLRGSWSQPSALLRAADAFVLDSFYEGWPLATMESLLAGTPVIMSEVGGAREQIGDHGERGRIVPNPLGNPESVNRDTVRSARFQPQVNKGALVAAMLSMIDERDLWEAARQSLAVDAEQCFDIDVFLARYADVLGRAASGQTTFNQIDPGTYSPEKAGTSRSSAPRRQR
jgi:glycosyltransferase involved in cell wall biosynthesis